MISWIALLARRRGCEYHVPRPCRSTMRAASRHGYRQPVAAVERAVVRTFTARRCARREARARGIDLEGCVMFGGGEHSLPTATARSRRRVPCRPRYVSTETGLIAQPATTIRRRRDALYTDRLAIVAGAAWRREASLLMTTCCRRPASSSSTDIGDAGALRHGPCLRARTARMELHVSSVGSVERLTAEGVAIPST